MNAGQREAVQRYLATGESDPLHFAWDGGVLERERRAKEDLIGALVGEVERRADGRQPRGVPETLRLERLTRSKVEPMVRGLFPVPEREAVLATLERSIAFVTRERLEPLLRGCSYLRSAWDIANLYLTSVGAELLSNEAMAIVGVSEGTTCFVSTEYFHVGGDRFADFILHEAAHVFHNCKRRTVGLSERGRREWLLDVDFRMRETFAYTCEAYGRILELGPRQVDRPRLLAELLDGPIPGDDRLNEDEYRAAVTEAVTARNGWKRILRRCASKHPSSRQG